MGQEKNRSIHGLSWEDEEKQLASTIGIAQKNLEQAERYTEQLSEELHEMLETYEAKDKETLALWHNTSSQLQESRKDLIRCQKARKKPYFGRIDFKDSKSSKEESYYVGRIGITENGVDPLVIDWRAAIASVYYENTIGRCQYKVKNEGTYEIDLRRKRTYEIANDTLIDFFDSDVVANDDLLTKYLAKSKKAVLGEIIATIQKEQNAIIRKSPKNNLIVQGVAGSGKTTVAMHRISYILYNYEDFRPEDFYIIGSNRILLDYITSVLPDLDVYGVAQMTMEQLFVRLLYEDWNAEKYSIRAIDKKDEAVCVKGSYEWFHDLEAYCAAYENSVIPTKEVRIEKNNVLLLEAERISSYLKEHPQLSMQEKINMLNEILLSKLENELIGKEVSYTAVEKKELQKQYRFYFGRPEWKGSIFELYENFLAGQRTNGKDIIVENNEFDVYDLAALAYLYKRIKETDGIREASHVIIDEAQDFGMMAYGVLKYCLRGCTYTIMGDVSQNIHYGYGLNDWEDLKNLMLTSHFDSFGLLKKSYRNTVEISNFATEVLRHGDFSIYPVEPIIRHGNPVCVAACTSEEELLQRAVETIQTWQKDGHETIAIVCRDEEEAAVVIERLGKRIPLTDSNLETAEFGSGIMVLPVEYTKGLEFDAVLIYNPSTETYPITNQHVKLLYVAATRALHELSVLHLGSLTELIAKPVSAKKQMQSLDTERENMENPEKKKTVVKKPVVPERKPESAVVPPPVQAQAPSPIPRKRKERPINPSIYQFGEMVEGTKIRPRAYTGSSQCLRSAKKTKKHIDFLSVYGTLRITPVEKGVVRVQFKKGEAPTFEQSTWDYTSDVPVTWSIRQSQGQIEIVTETVVVKVGQKTGAVQFVDQAGNVLLAEKETLPRQIETDQYVPQAWNYFEWPTTEKLVAKGIIDEKLEPVNQKARYISFGGKQMRMPLLLSSKRYGLAVASESTVMCCDIPMYGPYLYTEDSHQIDYYFIYGANRAETIKLYKKISL